MQAFEKEWEVLQNQYDSYEKCSLLIKCLAVTLFVVGIITDIPFLYLFSTIAILWLQDGIWKTFQSRIEERLYEIETAIATNSSLTTQALQFNNQFLVNRPSHIRLIKLYLHQSFRPTVAFPYVILIALVIFSGL